MAEASNSEPGRKRNGADIEDQLRALQDDLKTLSKTVAAIASENGAEANGQLRQKVADAASQARETAAKAGHRVTEAHDRVNGVIEANPTTSVLVAFGTGMALGVLARR